MGRSQQSKGGGYAGNKGNKTYASGGKCGGGNKKSVDASTALGLGASEQNTMLSGIIGRTGHGATKSSGLTFQIYGDKHYGRIGWLEHRLTVCE